MAGRGGSGPARDLASTPRASWPIGRALIRQLRLFHLACRESRDLNGAAVHVSIIKHLFRKGCQLSTYALIRALLVGRVISSGSICDHLPRRFRKRLALFRRAMEDIALALKRASPRRASDRSFFDLIYKFIGVMDAKPNSFLSKV